MLEDLSFIPKIIIIGILFIAATTVIGHIAGFIFGAIFDKAEKDVEKGDSRLLSAIFIVVIGLAIVGSIAMCSDSLKQCESHDYWEPRHTQTIMPYNHDNLFSLS